MGKTPPWEDKGAPERAWGGLHDWSSNVQTGGFHPGDPRSYPHVDRHTEWVRANQRLEGQRYATLRALPRDQWDAQTSVWEAQDKKANRNFYR